MRLRWPCPLVSVALLAGSPVHAAPVYYGFTSASSYAVFSSGPTNSDEFNGAVPGSSISYSAANGGGVVEPFGGWSADGQGTGSAQVNTAGMHLFAAGSGAVINAAGNVGANGSGYARGQFKDSFVVSVPSYSGAVGTLRAAVNVSGILTASGSESRVDGGWYASSKWAASLNLQSGAGSAGWSGGQSYLAYDEGSSLTGYNVAYPFSPFGSFTVNIPVIFGSSVSVDIVGVVSAYGLAGAGSQPTYAVGGGTSNLGSTIAWGGILGVYDMAGNPINDFTALSTDTGFDYRNPYVATVSEVPLPPALVLFASGLSFLAASQGRRSRRQST